MRLHAHLPVIVAALVLTSCASASIATRAARTETMHETVDEDARAARTQAIHKVTWAAVQYAEEHDGELPTTQQLAVYLGRNPQQFGYEVVISGKHDQHLKRVGGWPEILIKEKSGGAHGDWAFGYVDGLATNMPLDRYVEMKITQAIELIHEGAGEPRE